MAASTAQNGQKLRNFYAIKCDKGWYKSQLANSVQSLKLNPRAVVLTTYATQDRNGTVEPRSGETPPTERKRRGIA
ncbi:hypothetical protein [Mycobacterium avium]|uniref:hypothetical protein n=1 Tax=Mycobacterium avium TaxID=1764 RepID=UPI00111BDC57|nr:hypothetical protein [Mycobacterium avium]